MEYDFKQFKVEHYVFNYLSNSLAEKDIKYIADMQEKCYAKIKSKLEIVNDITINYFLLNTPNEVGKLYAITHNDDDDEPCNGFTLMPNNIYCVYNEDIKCIGMHEDTHILSYTINRPDCAFIREGLAMYMDEKWHGKSNELWCKQFIDSNKLCKLKNLLFNDYFYKTDSNLTYPIAGAFIGFVVNRITMKTFLKEIYSKNEDVKKLFENSMQLTIKEIECEFIIYINSICK